MLITVKNRGSVIGFFGIFFGGGSVIQLLLCRRTLLRYLWGANLCVFFAEHAQGCMESKKISRRQGVPSTHTPDGGGRASCCLCFCGTSVGISHVIPRTLSPHASMSFLWGEGVRGEKFFQLFKPAAFLAAKESVSGRR